ncbi:hypothetical protein CPB83DRAFT_900327 [Crepidotus variabilis]|uniref:Uncharacterized protein n=1 Tax=Crepidotus variabilis TaxID=179855 RepID=A0A9P6JI41_9AGAR|nr:hypothetical protein CPB83DRAFT_900327 [Crepidotus variabilis]
MASYVVADFSTAPSEAHLSVMAGSDWSFLITRRHMLWKFPYTAYRWGHVCPITQTIVADYVSLLLPTAGQFVEEFRSYSFSSKCHVHPNQKMERILKVYLPFTNPNQSIGCSKRLFEIMSEWLVATLLVIFFVDTYTVWVTSGCDFLNEVSTFPQCCPNRRQLVKAGP